MASGDVSAERIPDAIEGEDGSRPMILGKSLSSELKQEDLPSHANAPVVPPSKLQGKRRSTSQRFSRLWTRDRKPSDGGDCPTDPPGFQNEQITARSNQSETRKTRQDEARQTITKLKTSAADTLSKVGSKAAEGSAWVWEASKNTAQATADSLKKLKLFGTPLELMCKQESAGRVVPRLVLVCCTAVVSGDLKTERIFKEEAPKELVEALTDHFYLGNGGVLPPPGASMHVLAGVLKHFLSNLHEPLLTYRLAPDWIGAGQEPIRGKLLVQQLPQSNANAFDIVLDTCHRVSAYSSENEMDARALAEALVPVLLWKPPQRHPPKSSSKPANQHGLMSRFWTGKGKKPRVTEEEENDAVELSDSGRATESSQSPTGSSQDAASVPLPLTRVALQGGELEAVICVVTYLISEYRTM